MEDAMKRITIHPEFPDASSTATTIAAQASQSSKRKSSLSFRNFLSSSSSSRFPEHNHIAKVQLEKNNNALIEQLARERGAGAITPLEAQLRISELKREIKAVGEVTPRRDHTGLFSTTCSTDLLFLIDTTWSMSGYIAAAKEQIKNIVNSIQETFLDEAAIRMAVVSYKDHYETPHIEVLDFTSSADDVRSFLDKLWAVGGGDIPEDVLGGIEQALGCSWRQQNRCIIHIADAPPHGWHFNAVGIQDKWDEPGSEPHHLTYEPLIRKMIKLNINYALLRITNLTDHMSFRFLKLYAAAGGDCKLHVANIYHGDVASTMAEARQRGRAMFRRANVQGGLLFEEKELGVNYDALKHLVVRMVASSASRTATRMSGSSSQSTRKTPGRKLQSFLGSIHEDGDYATEHTVRLETLVPRWGRSGWLNETLAMEGFCPDMVVHSAHTLDEMLRSDDNIKLSIVELMIKKRSRPFAQGALRTASYAQTAASTNRFVVKAFKKGGKNLAHLAEDMRCQALCKAFALEFNALVDDEHSSIDFIVTTCLKGRAGDECLSLEPFIGGTYVKYNNNCGYVNEDKTNDVYNIAAQAFSHFTFERSKGQFLVCDLQGVGGLLTDPVIHTADRNRFMITDTNLNREGFKFFFSTHQCNNTCKKLELKSTAAMLPSNEFKFRDYWPGMNTTGCCSNKLCGKIVQVAKAKKSAEYPGYSWCDSCWPQLISSIKMCTSQETKHEFTVSDFFYESQGRHTPQLCPEHHAEDKEPLVFEEGEIDWEASSEASTLNCRGRSTEVDSPMGRTTAHIPASVSRPSTVSSTTADYDGLWSWLRSARRKI